MSVQTAGALSLGILLIALTSLFGQIAAPDTTISCPNVLWTDRQNVAINGNSIRKAGGVDNTWDAGAVSAQSIQSGDGYVEVTVDALDTYRMFGLGNGDSSAGYEDIEFAAYLSGDTLKVFEGGEERGSFGALAVGDVVRVAVAGGTVNYYHNGQFFYTSTVTVIPYPLIVDTSFSDTGARLSNVHLCIGAFTPPTPTPTQAPTVVATPTANPSCEPVAWANPINVTATGNSIQKTGGADNSWNAGAASTRAIQSGDGYVQATVDDITSHRMFGLSHGDTNANNGDIDFAAFLGGSALLAYERGLYRGVVGDLAVGDVVRVAVEGGVVRYYRNGNLVYTSATTPIYPLLVDTSINSTGGRITDVLICGADLGPSGLGTPTPAATSTVTSTPTVVVATATATATATQFSVLTPTQIRTPTSTLTAMPTATRSATRIPTQTATRTPTRIVVPTNTTAPFVTGTPAAGCPSFPADNIWHRNIAALPTLTLSDNYVASISTGGSLHANFGSGTWNGGPIGFPVITVPGTQPRVPISFQYAGDSDPGPYPVPTDAPIEGGPNSTGDRHVIVVDRDNCDLYELYNAFPQSDGSWQAGSGAHWNLNSNALRPNDWTSADAAGLPIYPSLVTYDEVQSGVIRHAMRFTAPDTQDVQIWPARHHSSGLSDPNKPPMGVRMRLKASVDISGYPTQLRVILQGLKDYGMFLADNGDPWEFDGMPDPRWNNNILQDLGNLHGSDFEAVDESSLMVDPNSGQSR